MRKPWIESRINAAGTKDYYLYREIKKVVNGKEVIVKESQPVGEDRGIAKRIRDKYRNRANLSKHDLVDPERLVRGAFNEYLAYSAKIKKPRTCQLIDYSARPFLVTYGNTPIVELESHHIERWKNETLEKSNNPNGLNIRLVVIKSFFQYCARIGIIKKNPAKGVKKEKKVPVARFLTNEEISLLLGMAGRDRNHDSEVWHQTELPWLIKVALYTGMRRGEVLTLNSNQISNGYILAKSKTETPRKIPIHQEILAFLTNRAKQAGPIFPRWSKDKLGNAFHYTVGLCEIGRIRFHDLRHTFCSRYLESGGTIADLRLITGHESLETLKIYAHFQNSYLNERIQGLSFGIGEGNLKVV